MVTTNFFQSRADFKSKVGGEIHLYLPDQSFAKGHKAVGATYGRLQSQNVLLVDSIFLGISDRSLVISHHRNKTKS